MDFLRLRLICKLVYVYFALKNRRDKHTPLETRVGGGVV